MHLFSLKATFLITLFLGCVEVVAVDVAPYVSLGPLDVATNGIFKTQVQPPPLPFSAALLLGQSPTNTASFLALGDNNTITPPDTQGAVGTNHLMVMLNSQVRIQTRGGTNLSTTTLANFWSSVGGLFNVTDPRLLYDPYNHRWIATATMNYKRTLSAILIGVSLTSDPTGAWNKRKV